MANKEGTEMTGRTIAIGDIHGCSAALAAIIGAIDPQQDDTIVTLGDDGDRGIDSKESARPVDRIGRSMPSGTNPWKSRRHDAPCWGRRKRLLKLDELWRTT